MHHHMRPKQSPARERLSELALALVALLVSGGVVFAALWGKPMVEGLLWDVANKVAPIVRGEGDAQDANDVKVVAEPRTTQRPTDVAVATAPPEDEADDTDDVDDADDVEELPQFFDPVSGEPLSGWHEEDGTTYLLADDGIPLIGWQEIAGQQYCFGEDGSMLQGWADGEDGERRYLKDDGVMASHEWVEVDGVWEVFDDDGAWIEGDDIMPPDDKQHVEQMSVRQQTVVNACDRTPWPGAALCALWVSQVFETAGEPGVGGDACDMARAWCVSDDLAELRPGMIIAVASHPRTENGRIWGHVCIYVGDGYVRDSGTYGIRRIRLGSWIAWFGATDTPKWGWANGIALG
jgi:hypothetical protein